MADTQERQIQELIQKVMDDYWDEDNSGAGEDIQNGLAARIVKRLQPTVLADLDAAREENGRLRKALGYVQRWIRTDPVTGRFYLNGPILSEQESAAMRAALAREDGDGS